VFPINISAICQWRWNSRNNECKSASDEQVGNGSRGGTGSPRPCPRAHE
jgi:hypothetical protein